MQIRLQIDRVNGWLAFEENNRLALRMPQHNFTAELSAVEQVVYIFTLFKINQLKARLPNCIQQEAFAALMGFFARLSVADRVKLLRGISKLNIRGLAQFFIPENAGELIGHPESEISAADIEAIKQHIPTINQFMIRFECRLLQLQIEAALESPNPQVNTIEAPLTRLIAMANENDACYDDVIVLLFQLLDNRPLNRDQDPIELLFARQHLSLAFPPYRSSYGCRDQHQHLRLRAKLALNEPFGNDVNICLAKVYDYVFASWWQQWWHDAKKINFDSLQRLCSGMPSWLSMHPRFTSLVEHITKHLDFADLVEFDNPPSAVLVTDPSASHVSELPDKPLPYDIHFKPSCKSSPEEQAYYPCVVFYDPTFQGDSTYGQLSQSLAISPRNTEKLPSPSQEILHRSAPLSTIPSSPEPKPRSLSMQPADPVSPSGSSYQ